MSWGAVAGGVIGAAGGMYSASQNKGQGQDYGKIVYPETFDFNEDKMRQVYDYASQGMSDVQAGNSPAWWTKLKPQLKGSLMQGAQNTYFGSGATRSQNPFNIAAQQGASYGTGPKSTIAAQSKISDQYAQTLNEIDVILNSQEADVTQRASEYYPNLALSIPQSRPYQVVGGSGSQQGFDGSALASQLGGGITDLIDEYNKNKTKNNNLYNLYEQQADPSVARYGGYDGQVVNPWQFYEAK